VLDINAEIITLGRELLIGRTVNTNGSWIAGQLTALGITVSRIGVAGDTIGEISSAIAESLGRRPSILITTGGLGPTYDDQTMEGLAAALNLPKEINKEALRLVQAKYHTMKLEMTSSRYKLALMPVGAHPLVNECGSAPGVFVEYRGTIIFSLPGVPREMMAMFMSQVLRLIQQRIPSVTFRERSFVIEGMPESSLAPIIDGWITSNRRVYLKSHPGGTESKPTITIHLSAVGGEAAELDHVLLRAEESFSRLVLKAGGRVRRQRS
jgi:nicotinamide-nucleotide amidase